MSKEWEVRGFNIQKKYVPGRGMHRATARDEEVPESRPVATGKGHGI